MTHFSSKEKSIYLLNDYFVKAMFNKYEKFIFNFLLLSFVKISVNKNRKH